MKAKQFAIGIASAIAMAAVAGCAMPQRLDRNTPFNTQGSGSETSSDPSRNHEVYTDLIRGMLAQGQYYAALAHIQQMQVKGNSDELTFLEAEARRRLGQSALAEKLYRSLLRTDYGAQSEHGLGLLYAERDLSLSIQHLRASVQRRPTDVEARNDLGYALMMAGRYGEALPELATAVELDPNGDKARNNLIILLVLSGDEAGVRRVAQQSGTSAESLARLRRQAQSLKSRAAAKRGGR